MTLGGAVAWIPENCPQSIKGVGNSCGKMWCALVKGYDRQYISPLFLVCGFRHGSPIGRADSTGAANAW